MKRAGEAGSRLRASGAEGVHHRPAGHASERRALVLDLALRLRGF